jgi:toxin ParE1/3/4
VKARYSRIAQADIRKAKAYYASGDDPHAGARFAAAFKHAMGEIRTYPRIGALYELGSRRLVMDGYPYSIIYLLADEEVFVVAVPHHKRDPGYWHHAVSDPQI